MQSVLFLAVLFLADFSTAIAEDCTKTQLETLINMPNVDQCTRDLGFADPLSFASLTSTQLKVLCSSKPCVSLFTEVSKKRVSDCTVPSIGVDIQSDVLGPIMSACGISPSASSSTSSEDAQEGSASFASSSSTISPNTAAIFVVFLALA